MYNAPGVGITLPPVVLEQLADIDGVVVIPRDEVQQIIALAKGKLEMETKRLAAIREGDLRPHWLNDALRKAGMLADGETL